MRRVTDVQGRKLWHDQRIAREGFEVARRGARATRACGCATGRSSAAPDGYRAPRDGRRLRAGPAVARRPSRCCCKARRACRARARSPSRPATTTASRSSRVAGALTLRGQRFDVAGKAWLDHEWSEEYLHPRRRGLGLDRHEPGRRQRPHRLPAAAAGRLDPVGRRLVPLAPGGSLYTFSPGEVTFSPQRRWTSPLSQAAYPVEWIVRTPADFYTVKAVIDNQELDSRGSTGAIYWEGLSRPVRQQRQARGPRLPGDDGLCAAAADVGG